MDIWGGKGNGAHEVRRDVVYDVRCWFMQALDALESEGSTYSKWSYLEGDQSFTATLYEVSTVSLCEGIVQFLLLSSTFCSL